MIVALVLVFAATLCLGFPVFVSLGSATLAPFLVNSSFSANAEFIIRGAVNGVDSALLLALPLFVLSGNIMGKGGISKRLFDIFALIFGKLPGGMAIAVVMTSVIYAAICGSGPAATAAVGAMAVPLLIELGYKKDFASTLVASGGGIGIIIPPSLPFITYAMLTGTSVGALFTAGIIPGILIAICLIAYVIFYCVKEGEDRPKVLANYEKLVARGRWKVFKDSFFALLSPVIILGGIYTGIFTPTEAAVVSVFYSLIICLFIYRSVKPKELLNILVESVKGYAGVGILIAISMSFSRVMAMLNVTQSLANFVTSTFTSWIPLMAIVIVVLLVIGMFMDVMPSVTIFAPILVPIMTTMGVDPVHFGIVLTTLVAVGMLSPPFGMNLYVASGIAKVPVSHCFKRAVMFCLAYIVAILFIAYIPSISLFLGRI